MEIKDVPFCTIDWEKVESIEHEGETGKAFWKTLEVGNIRVRMVEYTPGYRANHWCNKGHVLLVLEGELTTRLLNGKTFILKAGMSYQVQESPEIPHQSSTDSGAKLFIVD